ncbi:MAG: hypothetical protein K2N13_10180 [Paraprevotella sp.]|nr:hypothetical protein [Paraprevotella sp.]
MKNYLLLTALAMTASVAAIAQVKVLEKPVKQTALKAEKMERKMTMQRTEQMAAGVAMKNVVVKNKKVLGAKKVSTISLKDEEGEEETKDLYYRNPSLTFYTAACGGYIYPAMYQPAYANITWRNASSGYTVEDPFAWSYVDIEGNDTTVSSVSLKTAHFQGTRVSGVNNVTPILSCGEDSYQFVNGRNSNPYLVFYGWEPKILLEPDEETGEEWYLQLYDNWENHVGRGLYYSYTATSDPEDSETVTNQWAETIDEAYADYGVETQAVKVTSLGNILPAPASPYILSQVTFPVCVVNEAGAEVSMNIYAVNEEGYLDLLTTSTTVIEDAHAVEDGSYSIVDLKFNVKSTDEIGMVQDYLRVSTPVLIEIANINDNEKITELMGLGVAQDYKAEVLRQGAFYGITGLDATMKIGEETVTLPIYMDMPEGSLYWGDATKEWIKCVTSFDMSLDAHYPYLGLFDPDNDFATVLDSEINIELPATDAGKYFEVTSYDLATDVDATPEDWAITNEDGDELPEWLSVTASVQEIEGYEYTFLDILAEDVPENTPAREATVVVDAAGAVKTFHITQAGTDGNGTGITTVAGSNGEVFTKAVYTLDGQLVSPKNLAKGVYIVKKSDGTSAKIVKK